MQQIDWMLENPIGQPLSETKLIGEVCLIIHDRGNRHFEQAPRATSSSNTMVAVIDLTPWANHKFVFGWYSWGVLLDVIENRWMWTPHEYINWKRNFLKPPIAAAAFRCWLYDDVRAHADVNWYYPASVQAQVVRPGLISP